MSNKKIDLEIYRHSLSHIMAAAVKKLWPKIKFAIGPVIENGFYYDFDFGGAKINDSDFEKIEKEMEKIIRADYKFKKSAVKIAEAIKKEKKEGQIYKVELLVGLKKEGKQEVSYYELENFIDLCRGPHIESSAKISAGSYKIIKLAGAYWRGNEKNKMLTRIYGIAFGSKEELAEYLKIAAEAEKRDHRKIGKELDLFSLHDEGIGFPFWHPNGMVIFNELTDYIREENRKRGYGEVKTPAILRKDLWVTSGHWDKFKENMYFTEIEGLEYSVKPMNCPGGVLIYNEKIHSYRDLPIRYSEFGYVHRHELSGVLHGLFRVRAFTQDDAHSFCAPEQLNNEIIEMVDYAIAIYSAFGFDEYEIFIATKPEKYIGDENAWEKATEALKKVLEQKNLNYKIKEGEGAFYGPKIEFNVKDALRRNWQLGTIQVDFSMPARFGADYIDNKGNKNTPVMVHRAILGSLERFIGILIEHYAGAFPLWLAPTQIEILSVGESHIDFCKKLAEEFKNNNIRSEIDCGNETVGNKIRKAVAKKTPYILVVGDKEINSDKLAVRERGSKETREIIKNEFIADLKKKIKNKE
jgi:threonyl-tRNA synthetase